MTELSKKALIVRENWYKNDCKGLTTSVIKEAYKRGFNRAYSLLKGSMEPGWINVKDRLPHLNEDVLVYAVGKADGFIGEHDIEICNRYIQRFFPSSPGQEIWSSPRQYFHTDYEITHWMPMPEPPREESQDE